MQRVLQNTQATLSITFEVDGTATDPTPDTATVTITRADGTVLVPSTPATPGAEGVFTHNLGLAQTSLLDELTATWASSLGTLTTTLQIVGGFLFSISQARALSPLDDTTTYPTQTIVDTRTLVEDAIEDACGVAFVPRYTRETLSGRGFGVLHLSRPRITAIREVRKDGVALSAGELADLTIAPSGAIYSPRGWTKGFSNYVVGYEHGYPRPPAIVRREALEAARAVLQDSPQFDARATRVTTDLGTINLAEGEILGLPGVKSVIDHYGMQVGVA